MARIRTVLAAFGLTVLAAGAAAQEPVTVGVYWPADALFQGIAGDLAGADADAPLAQVVPASDLGFPPFEEALARGVFDIAIVPLDQALDVEFTVEGHADFLLQPIRAQGQPDPWPTLTPGFREFVLTELGHPDMFGLGLVGFGATQLVFTDEVASLFELDGRDVFTFADEDFVLDQLGARPAPFSFESIRVASVSGAEVAAELASPDLIAPDLGLQEIAGSVISGYRPIVFAAMIRADTWAGLTEAQRLDLRAGFQALEAGSFFRAQAFDEQNLAAFQEASGALVVPYAELMTDEIAAGLQESWAGRFPDSAGLVFAAYDASLVQPPPPDDRARDLPRTRPRLLFATDREAHGTGIVRTAFGVQHTTDARFRCGEIAWQPDPRRETGALHDAAATKFVGPHRQDAACGDLFAEVVGGGSGRALIFVHGFNNTFADAVGRAIAIAEDTGWTDPVVLWSWPSNGMVSAYFPDGQHVLDSHRRFEQFLTLLMQADGVGRLDMVTHSMGGRLGVEALHKFTEIGPDRLFHAVFVAPDVSDTRFIEAVDFADGRGLMTLYASDHDKPLAISRRFHDQPRAGQGGPHLIVRAALDTIDAGPIDREFFEINHTHAVELPEGLRDLTGLLLSDLDPPARGLTQVRRRGVTHFRLELDRELRLSLRRN